MRVNGTEMNGQSDARRPLFLIIAAAFIPVAYALCFYATRQASFEDFLVRDIARSLWRLHLPASFLAVLLLGISIKRRERFRHAARMLLIISGLWLAIAFVVGMPKSMARNHEFSNRKAGAY
jgi:hypothetical protein